MRALFRVVLLCFLMAGMTYLYLVWQNNRQIDDPTSAKLQDALEQGIQ